MILTFTANQSNVTGIGANSPIGFRIPNVTRRYDRATFVSGFFYGQAFAGNRKVRQHRVAGIRTCKLLGHPFRMGLSGSTTRSHDMNNLTTTNPTFKTVTHDGEYWLTAAEIAKALGYADQKSVLRLYSRNRYEFTDTMCSVVKLTTQAGERETKVFSLRGAHLLAMFAKTDKARSFRRSLLDIIEQDYIASRYTAEQAASIQRMAQNIEAARDRLEAIRQANDAAMDAIIAERRALGNIHDFITDGYMNAKALKEAV